jgi:hypothetical protein
MGGQQKSFISDIVFFQHQDGMRKKVRRHFLQCSWDKLYVNGLYGLQYKHETPHFITSLLLWKYYSVFQD